MNDPVELDVRDTDVTLDEAFFVPDGRISLGSSVKGTLLNGQMMDEAVGVIHVKHSFSSSILSNLQLLEVEVTSFSSDGDTVLQDGGISLTNESET